MTALQFGVVSQGWAAFQPRMRDTRDKKYLPGKGQTRTSGLWTSLRVGKIKGIDKGEGMVDARFYQHFYKNTFVKKERAEIDLPFQRMHILFGFVEHGTKCNQFGSVFSVHDFVFCTCRIIKIKAGLNHHGYV